MTMDSSPLRTENAAETRPVLVPAHGNGALRPFKPGQSGNPTGKGGLFHEAQRICREASPDAARRMVELMYSTDERVALMAADKVLERAWGKPKEEPDTPEDPTDVEARRVAREWVLKQLADMARPEPRYTHEAEQTPSVTSRRESRRLLRETDPRPPETWE
jgi:hypothetical protein